MRIIEFKINIIEIIKYCGKTIKEKKESLVKNIINCSINSWIFVSYISRYMEGRDK